ncbi:MAG: PstS family phosphate ABC transporter substrate-binding protein [Cyanobacteria bacterium P01_A01_bin.83]
MSSKKKWICDGEPKNPHYQGSNLGKKHESRPVYGDECIVCGLPKEAVVVDSTTTEKNNSSKPGWLLLLICLILASLGFAAYPSIIKPLIDRKESNNTPKQEKPISPPKPREPAPPLTSFLNFSQVPNVPEGVFLYGGSTTWAPIRGVVDSKIEQSLPNFQIKYTNPTEESGRTPGSSTGIRMLLDNELAFSQSSRQIKETEYQEAKQNGYNLKQIPVAIDGIAIAVNHELDITGLTLDQLKGIYTGKITNWSQVGGPDLKITPYSRRVEDGGTVEFFVEEVIESDFFPDVQFSQDTTTGLRQVSNDIGGIYYASAPEVVGQCTVKPLPIGRTNDKFVAPYSSPYINPADCPRYRNQLNFNAFQSEDYPITRKLYVVIKENGELEERVGKAYADLLLTNQGRELIENAGFVSLINAPN